MSSGWRLGTGLKDCAVEGCNKGGRIVHGLCRMHISQFRLRK